MSISNKFNKYLRSSLHKDEYKYEENSVEELAQDVGHLVDIINEEVEELKERISYLEGFLLRKKEE
jgi:hypothetical protein